MVHCDGNRAGHNEDGGAETDGNIANEVCVHRVDLSRVRIGWQVGGLIEMLARTARVLPTNR